MNKKIWIPFIIALFINPLVNYLGFENNLLGLAIKIIADLIIVFGFFYILVVGIRDIVRRKK